MRRRRAILISAVILLFAGACAAAFALYGDVIISLFSALRQEPAAGTTVAVIQEDTVRRGNLDQTVQLLGTLYAPRVAALYVEADGARVAEVLARPGATLKAGDPILRVESSQLQERVEAAKRALRAAEAELKRAQQPVSELDMAEKRLTVQLAETSVREAREALAQAGQADLQKLRDDVTAARRALDEARLAYAALQRRDDSAQIALLQEQYAPAAQRCAELSAKLAPNVEDLDRRWAVCNEVTDGADQIEQLRLTRQRELLLKQHDIVVAERSLARAQKALDAAGAGPDALAVAQAEYNLAEAEAKLAAAKAQLQKAAAGPDPDLLATKQAAVDAAQQTLADAEAAVEAATLRAPFDGTLTWLNLVAGDVVLDATQPVGEVADLSTLRLRADVDEQEIGQIHEGQAVSVTFDALPAQPLRGVVEMVPVQGRYANDRFVFTVVVRLEQTPAGLRLGMTAGLEVVVNSAKDVLLAPAAAVRQMSDGRRVVTVLRSDPTSGNRIPERRYITTGRSNGLYIEVLDGLREGDVVQLQYQTGENVPGR
jgi:HlyD family secretion protein